MNNQTKTLIAVAAVLLLIYFLYNRSQSGSTTTPETMQQVPETMENVSAADINDLRAEIASNIDSVDSEPIPKDDMIKYFPQNDYAPPQTDDFNRNANRGYIKSSYAGAKRGDLGQAAEWDSFFDENNNVFSGAQVGNNDNFLPIDESGGNLAIFKTRGVAPCGSNVNCPPEDLFDVDKYLPQEVNDDWFEVQPEPISVKNRHLINITKPIGVGTIGSHKSGNFDLRQAPANPQIVVSPWLQSTLNPDVNLKPLY